jgi:hypothetical protein
MTSNLAKGAKSPYDIQSRKMRYRRKGIDEYFDEVTIYFCVGVIDDYLSYYETLPCELADPLLPKIIDQLVTALTGPSEVGMRKMRHLLERCLSLL